LFASFERKERKGWGRDGRGGEGEGRENPSLVWELRN